MGDFLAINSNNAFFGKNQLRGAVSSKEKIGVLPDDVMERVNNALLISLGVTN